MFGGLANERNVARGRITLEISAPPSFLLSPPTFFGFTITG